MCPDTLKLYLLLVPEVVEKGWANPQVADFSPTASLLRRPTLNAVNPGWRVSIDRGAPYSNTAANFGGVD